MITTLIILALALALIRHWRGVLIFFASLLAIDLALGWLVAHCGALIGLLFMLWYFHHAHPVG